MSEYGYAFAPVPNWLMRRTEVSAGAKLTYARLRQYAGKGRGGSCNPRQDTLATELGVTARQVRRYLDELQEHGLVEELRMGKGAANRYGLYESHPWITSAVDRTDTSSQPPSVTVDRTDTSTETLDDRTDVSSHTDVEWTYLSGPDWTHLSGPIRRDKTEEISTNPPTPHSNDSTTRPSLPGMPSPSSKAETASSNKKTETRRNTSKPPAVPPEVFEKIFEAWKASTSRNGRTLLTDPRREVIKKALKAGYELEDLLDAVEGWKFSKHHRGENQQGVVYNDLDVLLRIGGKGGLRNNLEHFRDLYRDHWSRLTPPPSLQPPEGAAPPLDPELAARNREERRALLEQITAAAEGGAR